jgi:hypothetical protein
MTITTTKITATTPITTTSTFTSTAAPKPGKYLYMVVYTG